MVLGSYLTLGFPYGEVVLFMILLPFARAKQTKPLKKALFVAMLVSGLVLIISTVCTIMELGPVAAEKKYSLFVLAEMINIREIIERVEAVVGMAMITGSLIKAAITLFAIQMILTELFGMRDDRLIDQPDLSCSSINGVDFACHDRKEWEELVIVVHPLWVMTVYILPLLAVLQLLFVKRDFFQGYRPKCKLILQMGERYFLLRGLY